MGFDWTGVVYTVNMKGTDCRHVEPPDKLKLRLTDT